MAKKKTSKKNLKGKTLAVTRKQSKPKAPKAVPKLDEPLSEEVLQFFEKRTKHEDWESKELDYLVKKAEKQHKKGFVFTSFDLRHSKPRPDQAAMMYIVAQHKTSVIVDEDETPDVEAMKELIESLMIDVPMVKVYSTNWDKTIEMFEAKGWPVPLTPVKITIAKKRSKKA